MDDTLEPELQRLYGGEAQCAICLEENLPEADMAQLPCCVIPANSTTRFCTRCMDVICAQGPGGVGRCPNCRSFVKKQAEGGGFEVADRVDTCSLCNQVRTIVSE